jgi:hypothetical protein
VRGLGHFPLTNSTASQPTDSFEEAYGKTREQMRRLRLGGDQLRRTRVTVLDPKNPIKSIYQTLMAGIQISEAEERQFARGQYLGGDTSAISSTDASRTESIAHSKTWELCKSCTWPSPQRIHQLYSTNSAGD